MQDRKSMSLQASVCCKCGKAVSPDEIAITKKLINRGASAFYCVSCLAAYFEVEPKAIRERIAYFRAMGCTLFSSQNESEEAM